MELETGRRIAEANKSADSLVAVLDEESKSKDEESKSVVVLCSFPLL